MCIWKNRFYIIYIGKDENSFHTWLGMIKSDEDPVVDSFVVFSSDGELTTDNLAEACTDCGLFDNVDDKRRIWMEETHDIELIRQYDNKDKLFDLEV